ncbi:MAG: helix-turn-helix transcriptional regulator [Chloroflexota bacterium]
MTNATPLAAALDSCADALRTLAQALRTEQPPTVPPASSPDRLLTVEEAAAVLSVSKRWLYSHAGRLPFARHLSHRALRFSEAGLRRWIDRTR